jgi:hypothetical protein
MARKRLIAKPSGSEVLELTEQENIERDAEEAAWADGANDRAFVVLREKRNDLLVATDWRAGSDLTMNDAWKTYRQALRDLPANTADPANPTWPTKPGA